MELSLSERIERWLKTQDWVSGGEIERIVAEKTKYKPSYASRECRKLAEAGTLLSKQERGTVFYKYNNNNPIDAVQKAIEIFDAL